MGKRRQRDPPSALEIDDIGGRHADSGAEGYAPNHIVAGEFRDVGRPMGRGGVKTFDKTNLIRRRGSKRASDTELRKQSKIKE